MPPEQCPECGRFLAGDFVEQATPGPEPCPNCGTPLSFRPAPVPPALPPDGIPADDSHPLDSWGPGATAPPLVDEPVLALTPEELAMAGGGALLGALVVRRSRFLGAIVGAVAAVLSALWRRD